MASIYPVPIGRTSDALLQQRLLTTVQSGQADLLRLQDQLSTGRRITSPSDDAPAALRAIALQRLLEQRDQTRVNLTASQSYLDATDAALSDVSQLLSDIRATALSVTGTTATNEQRANAAAEVRRALQQLVDVGNTKFRGRYLFAGSRSNVPPFALQDGLVVYRGNQSNLQSLGRDSLLTTSINGVETFGGVSSEVLGTADLNPALTLNTKLADLRGGQGLELGSFILSDGTTTKTIDIRSAVTVGDVVRLIESNPPAGRQISVSLATGGLTIDIDDAGGGNLTVREIGDRKTAASLGILSPAGTGVGPLVGQDVNPRVTTTTRLSDLLAGVGFDQTAGLQLVSNGQTFTVDLQNAVTVEDVLNAINGAGANLSAEINSQGTGINVRSRSSGVDFQIGENGGTTAADLGIRTFTRKTRLSDLNHGLGIATTSGTDFVIQRKDGTQLPIDVSSAFTVGDVLDLINNHPGNQDPLTAVVARLRTVGNGIELVDANSAGTETLAVSKQFSSNAAVDLGLVAAGQSSAAASGSPETLSGRDVNPRETGSVFNSLVRLSKALESNDIGAVQRAVNLLDADFDRVTSARAEVGAQGQQVDAILQRLDTEQVQLRDTLSKDIDVDLVQAISALTAQQASFEASLRLIGQTFQLSLLNFL